MLGSSLEKGISLVVSNCNDKLGKIKFSVVEYSNTYTDFITQSSDGGMKELLKKEEYWG